MKGTLFICALLIFNISFSQEKIKGYVSLSQSTNLFFQFTETDLSVGIAVPLKMGVISLFGSYQRGGNFRRAPIPFYHMNYHLLGGGFKYRVLNPSKIYSPTIRLSALTEVGTNYAGKKLELDYYSESSYYMPVHFFPSNTPGEIHSSENYHTDDVVYFYVYDYISTPFIGTIFIGNEFKLMKSLFLNIAIGYQCRVVRTHYKIWQNNIYDPSLVVEPTTKIVDRYKMKNTKNGNIDLVHYCELNVGFNYIISFKKDSKSKEL